MSWWAGTIQVTRSSCGRCCTTKPSTASQGSSGGGLWAQPAKACAAAAASASTRLRPLVVSISDWLVAAVAAAG